MVVRARYALSESPPAENLRLRLRLEQIQIDADASSSRAEIIAQAVLTPEHCPKMADKAVSQAGIT